MTTYRTDPDQPRNLYRGDQYIGVCFDPADTALVVEALNEIERVHGPALPIVVERGRIHPDGPVHPGPGLLRRLGDAPPGRLSALVAAQQPPVVGQGRPDAHSGTEGRFWGEHPAHPTCIDVTNVRAGRPPGSEWACGPDCPREPERKADQA